MIQTHNRAMRDLAKEFVDDMGKNPLGDDPTLFVRGRYVIELYPDSIKGATIQIWRKRESESEHWRKWMDVTDSELNFDSGSEAREYVDELTGESVIKERFEE